MTATVLRRMIKKFQEGRGRNAVKEDVATVFDDTGTRSGPSAHSIACQTHMPYSTV